MTSVQNAFEKIEQVVGTKFVSDSMPVRYSYSMNSDTVLQGVPDIVVRPGTAEEVSKILKIANETRVKVIARGGGADLTGGAKPIGDGGIVLDVTRMNKVLDVDERNHIVTVETGISWSELCNHLSKIGNGYYTGSTGPASGFSATIGGGLSNHSVGGGGAAMYGNVSEQCVGLEVVLPTGELIYTGAKASKFVDKPFTRYGLGPDYSALFLGDVGIHGVKTKASLNIYPLPEYVAYNTYDITASENANEPEKCSKVWLEWQHRQLPLHDFFYYTQGVTKLLAMFDIKKNLKAADVQGGAMLYTAVARTQKELDINVEEIEKIARKEGLRSLGPTIEEGNLGKWFYEEDGRWQWAHAIFGMFGPQSGQLSMCLKCPTYRMPEIAKLYRDWSNKNTKMIWDMGGGAADFISFGVHPCYIDVAGGIGVRTDRKHREGQYAAWKELLRELIKLGGVHYWMGEIIGHVLVESGALSKEYYDFMITIKKALDPNKIMSPGKFHLGDNY